MFLDTFKGDSSRLSKRSSEGDKREFEGSFKDVLRNFKESVTVFQENLRKKTSIGFQVCFNEVFFDEFVVAWISSQLPEQKEGLLLLKLSLVSMNKLFHLFRSMIIHLVFTAL